MKVAYIMGDGKSSWMDKGKNPGKDCSIMMENSFIKDIFSREKEADQVSSR